MDINTSLVYDYIDEQLLSSSWEELGGITEIGFATPHQWKQLNKLAKVGFTTEQKHQLLDPKTFGEKMEWLVAECIEKKQLEHFVLCFKNGISSISDHHTDIDAKNFSLEKYKDCMMKVDPDDYGADFIKFIKVQEGVTLQMIQVKLGGSAMSKGGPSKPDTVGHVIHRFEHGAKKLEQFFQSKIENLSFEKVVYATRKISEPGKTLLIDASVQLNDRKFMWEKIWTDSIKEYAKSVGLKWIQHD